MYSEVESYVRRIRLSDVSEEPHRMLQPIWGYDDQPLVTLEEAVKPLVGILPDIEDEVYRIKKKYHKEPADGLSIDESAAIMIYTTEWTYQHKCLYYALNRTLRSEDRNELKPWFLYLKLLISAVARLPSAPRFIYRGIKMDLSQQYQKGQTIIWWAFSSCTSSIDVLQNENFLGKTGIRTMFNIECNSAKDISRHSYFQWEEEVLLPPATQFEVIASLQPAADLHVIQLREKKSKTVLLQPVSLISHIRTPLLVNTKRDRNEQLFAVVEAATRTARKADTTKMHKLKYVSGLTNAKVVLSKSDIEHNSTPSKKWRENGITFAGGQGNGDTIKQLNKPCALYVDDNQTLFIADTDNHRILEWEHGETSGQIVAGGNGPGNRLDQLNRPTDLVFDKETKSLIICDWGNRRVIRWFHKIRTFGEVIIENVHCCSIAIDYERFIYVSDIGKDEIRRYVIGQREGTLVAGGFGRGDHLNQLNWPTHIYVDRHQSVYVSDTLNHRVIKWSKEAKQGIIVAGGRGEGNTSNKLSGPKGLFVDHNGTLYVTDAWNNRIMRWCNGASHGDVIAGGNGRGQQANQLADPEALSFDQDGNMYVVDWGNHRIQLFKLNK